MKKQLRKLNVDGISEYFPAPTVMEGLFSLCTKLFGIHFKENKTCEIWHEDVIVYDILDKDGTYISTFYIDPYAREDKKIDTWMEAGAPNSGFIGTRPFSYLGLNLIPPSSPSEPAFMTYADVKDLFQKFGHGLQQMLTTVPYNEISGQFGIEWDAGFVCGKFFQKWVTRPEILTSISGHHITGQPLSQELASKVIKGAGLLDAYNMCYELFLSAFAIEIHVLPWNEHWHKVFSRTWANYMPIPLHKDDYSPNSMMFIFYDSLGANYYSLLWSEMLAADIFAAFEEAGFENDEKQAVVGKRYRDTYLSLGGSVSPTEVFRRFRGRDPSIQPMLTKFS